jgi:hypothetical protein
MKSDRKQDLIILATVWLAALACLLAPILEALR